jgi:folate-binding protein YgfZ
MAREPGVTVETMMTAHAAKAAFLDDRGVVKVAGEEARSFLDGLVTTNVGKVTPGSARFGALLTPQGKITIDFFITEAPAGHGGGFLIDCPRALAGWLAERLNFYRLRAKVTVEDLSDHLGVLAVWNLDEPVMLDLAFPDPRQTELGWRVLIPQDLSDKAAALLGATLSETDAYEAHRIACGAPKGGVDFTYGDAFPHDANMDRLRGVDFDKGCYVGQEVVSRMEHRGTARSRIVRISLEGAAPAPGEPIMAADKAVGVMGSSQGGRGLALVRLDRVDEAQKARLPIVAGGIALTVQPDAADASAKRGA